MHFLQLLFGKNPFSPSGKLEEEGREEGQSEQSLLIFYSIFVCFNPRPTLRSHGEPLLSRLQHLSIDFL